MAEKLTQYRIDQLEKKVDALTIALEKLMTNHLPHLDAKMESVKTRINLFTGINILAIILTLLFTRLIH